MTKLIALTTVHGGPVHINPDHILLVSSVMRDPKSQAIITMIGPVHPSEGADGFQGFRVGETLEEVLEKLGVVGQVDNQGVV